MISKNIALIGFMGSGKSLVSNKLGKLMGRVVFSTDSLIEKREGNAIVKIFEIKGEPYFREIEKQIVKEVSGECQTIIDCGGGIVLDGENIANLKKNSLLIYLSATAEFIYEQIKNQKKRPLLNVDDPLARIKELLTKRKALYENYADYTIDVNDKTIDQVAEEILRFVPNE